MGKGYRIYRTRDFIRKTEEGKVDLDRSLTLVRELAEAANFHQNHNLLIDLKSTTGNLNTGELLQVALEFARHKKTFKNKIAVLMPTDEDRLEKANIFYKAMDNQDFVFNYFTSYEDATDWLSIVVDFQ